ncbi:MAG: GNAT family N-acetyltransferase [Pseudomonadota bacterium]
MRLKTHIRGARVTDLLQLHAVIERAYRGDSARGGWTHEADLLQGPRTSMDILEAIVADPAQRLLSAWHGRKAIGCVAISDRGDGLAYLGQLCVEPVLQGAGIGRLLIAAAERTARATFGADRIEMTVIDSRHELIAYYRRRGYRVTGETRDFPLAVDPPLFMTVLERPLKLLADA